MVNSTFTLEAPGDVNRLPKRYLETPGDVEAPAALPRNTGGCRGSRSVTYNAGCQRPSNTYQLLLITANYYLLLLTIPLSYVLIHYDGK